MPRNSFLRRAETVFSPPSILCPSTKLPSRSAARPPDGAKVVRYHDYIDEKIESTRRMVKVVDLATVLVEMAVAVLLFLLVAAVVEHWLVPGGFSVSVRTRAVRRARGRRWLFRVFGGCGRCACMRSTRCTRRKRSNMAARRSRTA